MRSVFSICGIFVNMISEIWPDLFSKEKAKPDLNSIYSEIRLKIRDRFIFTGEKNLPDLKLRAAVMDKGSGSSGSSRRKKTKNPILFYSKDDPTDSSSQNCIPVYMFSGGDRYDPAAPLASGFDTSNSRRPSRKGNLPSYIQQGHNSSRNFRGTRFVEDCDPSWIPQYNHEIVFYNQTNFTVDGETRDADDPKNLPLLESLNNLECPDEFDQPGCHEIVVYRKWMLEERTQEVNYDYDGPVNHKWLPGQLNFQ